MEERGVEIVIELGEGLREHSVRLAEEMQAHAPCVGPNSVNAQVHCFYECFDRHILHRSLLASLEPHLCSAIEALLPTSLCKAAARRGLWEHRRRNSSAATHLQCDHLRLHMLAIPALADASLSVAAERLRIALSSGANDEVCIVQR